MVNVTLDKSTQNKWVRNLLVFLAPLGVLYLTTVVGAISQDNHVFRFNDLIPGQVAQGGLILWILNAALDYLRKLRT